jgi:hypothetical protein
MRIIFELPHQRVLLVVITVEITSKMPLKAPSILHSAVEKVVVISVERFVGFKSFATPTALLWQ